jgi:hypothetical protein
VSCGAATLKLKSAIGSSGLGARLEVSKCMWLERIDFELYGREAYLRGFGRSWSDLGGACAFELLGSIMGLGLGRPWAHRSPSFGPAWANRVLCVSLVGPTWVPFPNHLETTYIKQKQISLSIYIYIHMCMYIYTYMY